MRKEERAELQKALDAVAKDPRRWEWKPRRTRPPRNDAEAQAQAMRRREYDARVAALHAEIEAADGQEEEDTEAFRALIVMDGWRTWRFTWTWTPPSLNQQLRMHWARRARIKKEAALHLLEMRHVPKACAPRRLTLTRHGSRLLDADNLAGAYKPVVDAIVQAGLLTDDSPQSGNVIEYRQTKGKPLTVVELADLPPEDAS